MRSGEERAKELERQILAIKREQESWEPDLRLLEACKKGNAEAARQAIQGGARPEGRAQVSRMPPMMMCAAMREAGSEERREQVMRELIGAGAPLEAKGPGGMTALLTAIAYGQERLVGALLEAGADWKARSESGVGALELCQKASMLSGLLKEAQRRGELDQASDQQSHDGQGLMERWARRARDEERKEGVRLLLELGFDPWESREGSLSAMEVAASLWGEESWEQELVERMASCEATGPKPAQKRRMEMASVCAKRGVEKLAGIFERVAARKEAEQLESEAARGTAKERSKL